MDQFQLLAVVAISAAVGFIAAHVRNGRQMREFHKFHASAHIMSLTQLVNAALKTMVEDFKLPEEEARTKLFVRAEEAGMKLMRIDPSTGEKIPLGDNK